MTPSENELFELALDKCIAANKIVAKIAGNRLVLRNRYISVDRVLTLEAIISDIHRCISALQVQKFIDHLNKCQKL